MWAAVTKGSAECIYLEDAHRSVVGSSQGHFQKVLKGSLLYVTHSFY